MSGRKSLIAYVVGGLVAAGGLFYPSVGNVVPPPGNVLPPPDAGESAQPPTVDNSMRRSMHIVGSSTMQETLTPEVVRVMAENYAMVRPIIEPTGTTEGIRRFCAGVGTDYPDIVAASRIIRKGELNTCRRNKVFDVIEVRVGYQPILVVTKRGDPVYHVTPRMFYLALAAELPDGSDFKPNTFQHWRSVEEQAPPDVPISIIIPDEASGSRSFFDDHFLQGGCRDFPGISRIYAAAERVPRCIRLREDEVSPGVKRVRELPEPYVDKLMDAFAASPRGTLAIVGELAYLRFKTQLDVLPVNGVLPTTWNVQNYRYEMVSSPRYYVKRAHMRNKSGGGVVRGLREFMRVLSRAEMIGPGDIFDDLGFVPLDHDDIEDVQEGVATLRSVKR